MNLDQLPKTWQKAIERGHDLHVLQLDDMNYAVESVSNPGWAHQVVVVDGKIIDCVMNGEPCKGWYYGGRERPCKHAGAVAGRILLRLQQTTRPAVLDPAPIESPSRGRSQILREAS